MVTHSFISRVSLELAPGEGCPVFSEVKLVDSEAETDEGGGSIDTAYIS